MNNGNMRFGTDGIRGVYGVGLDESLAYAAGLAASEVFAGGKAVLARDTRESSGSLKDALIRGLTAGGTDVLDVGILPSPAAAYLTSKLCCNLGIMVTASHNPPKYNGIKFFSAKGIKLSEDEEQKIEYYIDNPPHRASFGKVTRLELSELYLNHLTQSVGNLSGISIVADCGNGATSALCGTLFRSLGAGVKLLSHAPNPKLINVGCGALYPEIAAGFTKCGYDIGFSFDGDGDRLSVSQSGKCLDGDTVLYNLASLTNAQTVVGTILSNSALEHTLSKEGKRLLRTPVGDKYISRLMLKEGHMLGGEQSGHFIVRPYSQTGDALLTSLLLCKYICEGNRLETLDLVPQYSLSLFSLPSTQERDDVKSLINSVTRQIEGKGRLCVRMSGTEPKLRIMVETTLEPLAKEILQKFSEILSSKSEE